MTEKESRYRLVWALHYAREAERSARTIEACVRRVRNGQGNMVDRGEIRRGVARLRRCADKVQRLTQET